MFDTRMPRIEHDSLGSVELPDDSLYGAQTFRAIENFRISGRTAHPALIRGYLRLKAAAAQANLETGALDERRCRLIQEAIQVLLKMPVSDWERIFPIDPYQAGAGTSQHMNTNEVIANVGNRLVGQPLGSYDPLHPNDHVNRSQSTNDTFPTATRLALLEMTRELLARLNALSSSLDEKARQWANLPKAGRTHLQDAVPIRLGQEFSGYAATVQRCSRFLANSCNELHLLGIGGSAVGTGLNVPVGFRNRVIELLSQVTGEPLRAAPNLFEAMQSQFALGAHSSALRILALELTRICNDLRLLASGPLTGLAEIVLPSVQPGSSIMPGKVNPSILEMANQAWFSVLGYDQSIAYALQAGQLELNVMMPVMAYSGLEATRIATEATRALQSRCIDGIEADTARLRRYFESTPQVATALSPKLGYERVAELVNESVSSGTSVVALALKKGLITEEEARTLLDHRRLTEPPAS